MGYFKENISQILSLIFLSALFLWLLIEAIDKYGDQKEIRERDQQRARQKSQNDLIKALLKEKRFDAAKRQIEAPIDKNGNYCSFDEQSGEWLQRTKNGTWRKYRP